MTISLKDMVGKIIGTISVLLYVLSGSINTMESLWNGPPGQLVRALGKCFHPDTSIKLKDGTIKYIKDIDLGDILEDGSRVESTMKIDNKKDTVTLFKIKGSGINNEDIYVTGSHLVFDELSNKFIKVEEYSKA